jgi:hypothetical protein
MERGGEFHGNRFGPSLTAADEDPFPPSFASHGGRDVRHTVPEPLRPIPLASQPVLEHRGVELARRAPSDLAGPLVRRLDFLLVQPAQQLECAIGQTEDAHRRSTVSIIVAPLGPSAR